MNIFLSTDIWQKKSFDWINGLKEIDGQERYAEKVHSLTCFKGIKRVTALAIVVEIGNFNRFTKASSFSAFLGLVSSCLDSGDKYASLGITKQGNTFLRKLLVEASQSFTRTIKGVRLVSL